MVMKTATVATTVPETRTISAAEFKAKCLQLMDEVNEHKLKLVVTKRGKPVAEVSAPVTEEKEFRSIIGRSPNVRILGDIISPLPQELTLPKWAWDRSTKKKRASKKK